MDDMYIAEETYIVEWVFIITHTIDKQKCENGLTFILDTSVTARMRKDQRK